MVRVRIKVVRRWYCTPTMVMHLYRDGRLYDSWEWYIGTTAYSLRAARIQICERLGQRGLRRTS